MIPRFRPDLGWKEFVALFLRNRGAVERFEREFAEAFGAVDAVAFPYGRSAQWAFFNAVGLTDAAVIMPAYTCSVVAHAVTLSGNHPRFVDIRLDDYNMDLDLVATAVNEKTRAIIATHTFGYPQDIDRLEKIVRDAEHRYGHKVWLMQDCCHAFGAEWNGRKVGTSGDVAVYAFNISKIMTSIFGGMLTFQDQALADKVRAWRDAHYQRPGRVKSLVRRAYLLAVYIAFQPQVYALTWWLQNRTSLLDRLTKAYHLDEEIHFPPDYLDRMLEVEAAVGLTQLAKYPSFIRQRRENAIAYHREFTPPDDWNNAALIDGATYSHYALQVPDRNEVRAAFAKSGVELGELIQYSIPALNHYKEGAEGCQHSEHASLTTVNFPVDSTIDSAARRKIIQIGQNL